MQGRKQFFFEKKNQKTFIVNAYAAGESRDSDVKVFCFFSSEKKACLRSLRGICLGLLLSIIIWTLFIAGLYSLFGPA